jgi:hypothetical protein
MLALAGLGLFEEAAGLLPLPALVQGICGGDAVDHAHERIAAVVGELDGPAGVGHRLLDSAQRHFQLAEIAGTDRSIRPILLIDTAIHSHPHRLHRLGEASEGAEAVGGFIEQPGLSGGAGRPAVFAGLLADEMNHCIAMRDVVIQLEEDGLACGESGDVLLLSLHIHVREAQIDG